MKLGITMLVIGLIFAGFGVFLWSFGTSPGPLPITWFGSNGDAALAVSVALAVGKGMTLFGGGLSLGGLVRMIVKR